MEVFAVVMGSIKRVQIIRKQRNNLLARNTTSLAIHPNSSPIRITHDGLAPQRPFIRVKFKPLVLESMLHSRWILATTKADPHFPLPSTYRLYVNNCEHVPSLIRHLGANKVKKE